MGGLVNKMSKNRFKDSDDDSDDKNSSAFWKEPEDLMDNRIELDNENDDMPSYEELQPDSIIISDDDSNISRPEFIAPTNNDQPTNTQQFNSSNVSQESSKDGLIRSSEISGDVNQNKEDCNFSDDIKDINVCKKQHVGIKYNELKEEQVKIKVFQKLESTKINKDESCSFGTTNSSDIKENKNESCVKLTNDETTKSINFCNSKELNKNCEDFQNFSFNLNKKDNLLNKNNKKAKSELENETKEPLLKVEDTVSIVSSKSTGIVEEVVSLNDDAQLIDEYNILESENKTHYSDKKNMVDNTYHNTGLHTSFTKIEKQEKNSSDSLLTKSHNTVESRSKEHMLLKVKVNRSIDMEQLKQKVPLIKKKKKNLKKKKKKKKKKK